MESQRLRVAAYALICDSDRILLCRISKELPRWQGAWTLPGGGLNFGEHPEQAMVREVREETGLDCEAISIAAIDSIHDPSGDRPFHGIRIIYKVKVIGGELRDELSGTTDLCGWQPLDSLENITLVDLAEVGVRLVRDPAAGASRLTSDCS